jgi:hypothetical protein
VDPLILASLPILGGLVTGVAAWSVRKVWRAAEVVSSNATLLECVDALERQVRTLTGQVADYKAEVVRLERILGDYLEVKELRAKRHEAREVRAAERAEGREA